MKTQNVFFKNNVKRDIKSHRETPQNTMLREKLANRARRVSLFFVHFARVLKSLHHAKRTFWFFARVFSVKNRGGSVSPEAPNPGIATPRNRARTLQQKLSGKMLIRMIPMYPMGWIGEKEREDIRRAFPRAILGYRVAFCVHQMQQRRYIDPTIWCFRREGFTEHEKHKTCSSKTL